MKQKHKLAAGVLLLASVFIIFLCMAIVWIFSQVKENRLITQKDKTQEEIEIDGTYLEIIYPWDISKEQLQQAGEEDILFLKDSGMEEKLTQLAGLVDGELEIEASHLWIDEAGVLIYQSQKPKGLSFAVERNVGIIGFGIEPAKEKDIVKKQENVKELALALADPMQELYTIVPALQEALPGYKNTEYPEDFLTYSNFESINEWKRQVLYQNNTLKVILQMEQQYLVLEFQPDTGHFTSYFFIQIL